MFGERFQQAKEREKTAIDWQGLKLPELKPEATGYTEGRTEWELDGYNGLDLKFLVDVKRSLDQDGERKAKIDIYVYDKAQPDGDRIATFKLCCNREQPGRYYDSDKTTGEDRKQHTYWLVIYRRVEKEYRHNGLGTLGVQLLEKLAMMVGDAYPEAKGEWIEMNTQLSSIARLIADHEWLERSGLQDYISPDRPDLGYLPHPKDEQDAFRLITGVTEELDDIKGQPAPSVRFRKKME